MRRFAVIAAVLALVAPAAARAGNPQIAGLQVALRAHGLYLAQIDGIAGPETSAAVHTFQREHGLPVGVAGARTRAALGPLGSPLFGARVLHRGDFGWDVAVLQFLMTKRGVYSGALDGYMGKQTVSALRHYQRELHLQPDAIVGPRTLSAIVRADHVPVRTAVKVVVVSANVYVVRPGDSLTAIAAAHRTTVAALAAANHLDAAKPIEIGLRLRVPAPVVAVTRTTLAPQSVDVRSILDAWSTRLGVDPHLVRALAWMESGDQTQIVSPAGAVGVLQTLPTTRAYVETVLAGHPIPHTVDGDVEVGVLYLRHLLQVFGGNEHLALAGWYEGEKAVRSIGIYKVTKPFVADVLALSTRM